MPCLLNETDMQCCQCTRAAIKKSSFGMTNRNKNRILAGTIHLNNLNHEKNYSYCTLCSTDHQCQCN